MALWGGRFASETRDEVAKYTESISFDRRLFKHDIEGSRAHVAMLGAKGIIPKESAEAIRADPERITQVFVNLFNNAARYKRPEQGEALCSVTVRPDGNCVKILVHDEGVGISPEKIGHVFEPFFQEDLSDTRSGGGAGLGLSIVRGIVAAHGGTVQVESAPGTGTTFCVRLPY